MARLTDEAMWEAVINNNSEYDGVFYFGVKTTGIFCRPSCKSKIPHRKNILFFADSSEALRLGYRPCKRCRPDLPTPLPDPAGEISDKTSEILQSEYSNPALLAELPSRVGVSPFHLQRSYKRLTGLTPKARLQEIRIRKAKELLEENKLNNTEICFEVGFQSLSSFYSVFRAITGLSPGEYKRNYFKHLLEGD